MIHYTNDQEINDKVEKMIDQYNDGDHEMTLPYDLGNYDKPVLLYVISQLLASQK